MVRGRGEFDLGGEGGDEFPLAAGAREQNQLDRGSEAFAGESENSDTLATLATLGESVTVTQTNTADDGGRRATQTDAADEFDWVLESFGGGGGR